MKKDVRKDSRVFHDLGLRGSDASEFLNLVFEKFKVDPTGFVFSRFFKGEYYSPVDIFNGVVGLEDKTRKELTVAHLVDVCDRQKWFDPGRIR